MVHAIQNIGLGLLAIKCFLAVGHSVLITQEIVLKALT